MEPRMEPRKAFDALAISGSGLSAQRRRLSVIAENIAHAHDTNRGDGTPYRRKQAVFETELQGKMDGLVKVSGVVEDDKTPLEKVHIPGHPNADKDGMVSIPNVNPIFEMVDLMAATRAYEANLQVARAFRGMVDQTLSNLR
jgi:flagellar basal-body rod protein FlgC